MGSAARASAGRSSRQCTLTATYSPQRGDVPVPNGRMPHVAQNRWRSVRVLQRYSVSAPSPASRRNDAAGTIAAQLRCLVHSEQLQTRVAADRAAREVDVGREAHGAAMAAAVPGAQAARHCAAFTRGSST